MTRIPRLRKTGQAPLQCASDPTDLRSGTSQRSAKPERVGTVRIESLTGILAERIMGWTVAPHRFLMGDRRWIPTWRFQPLNNLEHAFQLLEMAAKTFTLTTSPDGAFTARVQVGNHIGTATGEPKATSISVAVGRAIGLAVSHDVRLRPKSNGRGQKNGEPKR
jgi:hypothetical protein